MEAVALSAAVPFLSMLPLLKPLLDYLKGLRETQEVQERLKVVLQSLTRYEESSKSAKKSADVLKARVISLRTPVTAKDGDILVMALVKFCDDFSELLSNVLEFGKECNGLVSHFESFMEDVRKRRKNAYEIVSFFGKHYDPKTDSLDLNDLPMFVRVYGKKLGWKKNKQLSNEVSEGAEIIRIALLKALVMSGKPPRIRNRLQKEFLRSLNGLLGKLAKFKGRESIESELSRNAPPWVVELSEIVKQVQDMLPELSKRKFR
jgi:hypothetical protein